MGWVDVCPSSSRRSTTRRSCCSMSHSTAWTPSASRPPWTSLPTRVHVARQCSSRRTCGSSRSMPARTSWCFAAEQQWRLSLHTRWAVRTVPVPTVRSSTDSPFFQDDWAAFRRAASDVMPLLRFRASALRGAAKVGAGLGFTAIVVLTALAAWVPSQLNGAGISERAHDIHSYLPAACAGALLLLTVAAVSGGGRELLPREQAVTFPVSPTTDHLGALLMAPLNIAWLVQVWALLGANAYATGGKGDLLAAQVPLIAWLVAATVLAQAVSWAAEWIRRGRGGIWLFRAVAVVLSACLAALLTSGALDWLRAPMTWIARGSDRGADGDWLRWLGVIVALLALIVVATLLGAVVAHHVARRPPRDELRTETAHHPPRHTPAPDLAALIRVDRAGI